MLISCQSKNHESPVLSFRSVTSFCWLQLLNIPQGGSFFLIPMTTACPLDKPKREACILFFVYFCEYWTTEVFWICTTLNSESESFLPGYCNGFLTSLSASPLLQSVQLLAARSIILNTAHHIKPPISLGMDSIHFIKSQKTIIIRSLLFLPNIISGPKWPFMFQRSTLLNDPAYSCHRTLHMTPFPSRILLWLFSSLQKHLRYHLLWEVFLSLTLEILA